MAMQAAIQLFVQGSLVLLIFAVGVGSGSSELAYVAKRPSLLVRGFIAVNIVVPACALLLCLAFSADKLTEAGIVSMAVSPLAPFVVGKMLKTGADRDYVIGTYAALMAVSVAVVPATFWMLGILLGRDASVPVLLIGRFVGLFVALPLIAGVMTGTWLKGTGRSNERVGVILGRVALVCLLPVVIILIYRTGGAALALIGDGSLAIIVLTVVAGMAAGHWLGGPEPARRMALAQAAATRHPGIAILVAHRHFADRQVTLAIILFLLTSIVVSAIYAKWMTRRIAVAGASPAAA
jgi:BASS family bile acid:Na+ symporter